MKRTKQLASRFREVMLNGLWIANTNYKQQCSSLNWEQATMKIGSLNTIAILANHINYYIAGVLNVLEGGTLDIRDKYSFDFPPITSQEEWEKLLNTIWNNSERFAHLVEIMDDKKLDDFFVDEKYGNYQRSLDGMIEHCYYHLGQISLIKKMILELEKLDKNAVAASN